MVRARSAVAVLALVGGGWAAPAHAAPQSTTTLVLSNPTSAYGDTMTLSAQVSVPGSLPEGDVVFTVDGTPIKANLGASGIASTVLRRSTVGQHAISATFVPQFPDRQTGSSSPTQTWVVTPARTRLQVRVTGRGVRIPTSVAVAASGEYGTRPTGSVTVSVRHLGTGRTIRREKELDAAGTVLARFGTLRAGSYRLRVSYAGDTQHLTERHSSRFGVRQR